METNKIICGDSATELKSIPDNSIDLVLTSPPYNFNMAYDSMDDKIDWDEYHKNLNIILAECCRVLKWGGRMAINIAPYHSDFHPTHMIITNDMLKIPDMKFITEIIWQKNNYNCAYTCWGSWKSPSSPYFKSSWEYVEVFAKGIRKHEGDKSKIDITADEFKKYVYSLWSLAPAVKDIKRYGHPAIMPEKLAYRLMKILTYQDDIVLDPFAGVGTTLYVANQLKRKYIGIELSENYCDIAKKRLAETKLLV